LTGTGGFPLPNSDASGFVVNLTESTATITLSPFDDGAGEGAESLSFSVVDGESYGVADDANAFTLTLNDGSGEGGEGSEGGEGGEGGEGADIIGTDAGETLVGTDEKNTIDALGGDDTVAGGLENDIINGGDGDDILRGDRNARSPQNGEPGGNDIIFGGDGNDRIGGK
ncbi:MAG: hypothetical protein AAFP03_19755, partial [Cyanobacteria bacterium J06598_3]